MTISAQRENRGWSLSFEFSIVKVMISWHLEGMCLTYFTFIALQLARMIMMSILQKRKQRPTAEGH